MTPGFPRSKSNFQSLGQDSTIKSLTGEVIPTSCLTSPPNTAGFTFDRCIQSTNFEGDLVLMVCTCISFLLCLVVSKPPEVLIKNGHFTWRQQEEPGEEERVFSSTAGELTNINFSIEAVSALQKMLMLANNS